MKEFMQEKEFNDLEMQLVEAQKKLEEYEDELDKLNKTNERLVKEIAEAHLVNELQAENANLKERIFMKSTLVDSLKAENAKLRKCVEFYAMRKNDEPHNFWHNGRAIECLKELGEL